MDTNDWLEKLVLDLEDKTKEMKPSEFRFYNIAHFPILAQKTLEFSHNCPFCKNNLKTIRFLVDSLPESINQDAKIRKQFESDKNKLEEHLQQKHRCRFPGYYASLGSLAGLVLGLIFAFTYWRTTNQTPFNKLTLTVLAALLLMGRGIGIITDKKYFKGKLQL